MKEGFKLKKGFISYERYKPLEMIINNTYIDPYKHMAELRSCEKCGSMFPIYEDTNKDQKYCAKHRGDRS